MTRQMTCSSPGKVEGNHGCVPLIPKEVNEQQYMSFYKMRHIFIVDSRRLPPEFDKGTLQFEGPYTTQS